MALGILAQLSPPGTTLSTLYTSPSNTKGMCELIVTNRDSEVGYFRVAISPDGVAVANEQYIAYDKPINGGDSVCSVEFSLNSNDIVRVYSDTGLVSFTLVALEGP